MRFSLLLVVCSTLVSSTLAAPVLGQGNPPHPQPAAAKPPPPAPAAAKPPPAANPGDVVIVKSKDFLGPPIKGGNAPNKPHPAIVVAHDDAHVVSVAPIGHKIPGTKHVEPATTFGLPENHDQHGNPSLVDTGAPKQVHQVHLKAVNEHGTVPKQISPEHLESLQNHIAANAAKDAAPPVSEKNKKLKVEGPVHPAAGLYDDLPPPKSGSEKQKDHNQAPPPSLYDDLPPPKNQGAPAAGASNSKKRPLERRSLHRRLPEAYHEYRKPW